ncbi:hypothetical protein LPJ66_009258 [Kickxella alabastrina]|uniref:Uncharacterized protein n=1 Tax=Kickxella alabastrina TaxID=61397 RepID=A0ACC1I428_9FUNG|nr:hypothetical protein LPJ66_009258 [Kickxella alabastrina]
MDSLKHQGPRFQTPELSSSCDVSDISASSSPSMSPASSCPSTPSMQVVYAANSEYESCPAADANSAEYHYVHTHHAGNFGSAAQNYSYGSGSEANCADSSMASILGGTLTYPTSTCRLNRSSTMSSTGSSPGFSYSNSSASSSASPSLIPEPLPPIDDYLEVLSKAASAQLPLPTISHAQPRFCPPQHSPTLWSYSGATAPSRARFTPY